jgi:hypothetical protein
VKPITSWREGIFYSVTVLGNMTVPHTRTVEKDIKALKIIFAP